MIIKLLIVTLQVLYIDIRYKNGDFVHNNLGSMPSGRNHPNWNKKHINNGVSQKIVSIEELDIFINDGWILGTLQKGKKTISSHFDRIWINKDFKNKRILEEELESFLQKGWIKGRIFTKKYKKIK